MQFKTFIAPALVALASTQIVAAQNCDLCPSAGCPAGTTCQTLSNLGLVVLVEDLLALLGINITISALNDIEVRFFLGAHLRILRILYHFTDMFGIGLRLKGVTSTWPEYVGNMDKCQEYGENRMTK